MSTVSTVSAREFDPRRGLLWLGGFGAFGLTLSGVYATTGLGAGCPFRLLTGWECPFCGGTRLGGALLHGDVTAAFAYNPVVFLGLVVLTLLGAAWLVEVAGGPRLRPPAAVSRQLRSVSPTAWLVLGLVAAVLYTVLRNLL